MIPKAPATKKELANLLKLGEGLSLEFKRSTGELKEAMQTLCTSLNGMGGTVLFGIKPDGTMEGQEVSDQTLRVIAQAVDRFEPPVHVSASSAAETSHKKHVAAVSPFGNKVDKAAPEPDIRDVR